MRISVYFTGGLGELIRLTPLFHHHAADTVELCAAPDHCRLFIAAGLSKPWTRVPHDLAYNGYAHPLPVPAKQVIPVTRTGRLIDLGAMRIAGITDLTPVMQMPKVAGNEGWLAVNPTAKPFRNWLVKNWITALSEIATKTKLNFLLMGDRMEWGRCQAIQKALPKGRSDLLFIPLEQCAARLQNCMGFVGGDSGLGHLAAALGLPTLTVGLHPLPLLVLSPKAAVVGKGVSVSDVTVADVQPDLNKLCSAS